MVKEVIQYQTSDGQVWSSKEVAEAKEKVLAERSAKQVDVDKTRLLFVSVTGKRLIDQYSSYEIACGLVYNVDIFLELLKEVKDGVHPTSPQGV